MSCASRSTSASCWRQAASSRSRSLARRNALYSSVWPSSRPSSSAFWSIMPPPWPRSNSLRPISGSRVSPGSKSWNGTGAGQRVARPAEQVLVHGDVGPPGRQRERLHRIGAPLINLERQQPARLEHPLRTREQGARRVESVGPAHQGLARLEQPHGGVDGGVLLIREVRRGCRPPPAARPPARRPPGAPPHPPRPRGAPPRRP